MGYRPTRPWAYAPLIPQRVPPAWRPPMPVGFVEYPQPVPPGMGYLPSFAENYCAGGASRRGISVGSYMTAKDASALASVHGPPPSHAVQNYHHLLEDDEADLFEDEWDDDADLGGADYSVGLGSYNRRRLSRMGMDEDESELLDILGLEPDEIDALFSAEIMAFGAEAEKAQEAKKRPFAKISALFKRDASGQSKISRTTGKIAKLSEKLDELQTQYAPEDQGQPMPAPMYPVASAQPARRGMSTGAKVGIGVGVFAALGLIGFGVYKATR